MDPKQVEQFVRGIVDDAIEQRDQYDDAESVECKVNQAIQFVGMSAQLRGDKQMQSFEGEPHIHTYHLHESQHKAFVAACKYLEDHFKGKAND